MKSLKNLLRILIVAALTIPLTPIAPATADEITGFDQLSECVRSEGTSNLNLFFLVDSSKSLKVRDRGNSPGTDPNDLRADVLSQSIQQIAELNSDSVKVSFALTTFDKTAPGKGGASYPWTEASTGNAQKASDWVEDRIPDQDDGPYTDWRAGLKEAQSQLSKAPTDGGKICKAIIWFTDGELDVNGNKNQNADAIKEMCGVTPTDSKAKGDVGIVPSLRRDGVVLIGVLLRAGEGQTGKGLVTYFGPIVTGAGSVDSSVFGGNSAQEFECGTNPIPQSYGHGSVIVATSPDDLAREFLKMIFIIKYGEPLETNGKDEFTVDPGVSDVSVLIPSDKWVIEGPGKIGKIANNSRDSKFNIETFGRTSTVAFKVSSDFEGKWKVKILGQTNEQITVFMKSGLRISVDKRHSTLTAGVGAQDISGYFKRGDSVADLSVYNQAKTSMTITQIDLTNQGRDVEQQAMTIDPDGSWHGLITPLGGASNGSIRMSLKLVTKSGVVLPEITQTYNFDLFVPGAFCQVPKTLKLSDLIYKPHAPATGKLQIEGGDQGTCAISFQKPTVLNDPLGRTSSDFDMKIVDEENQQEVMSGDWRQIESGAIKTYIISIENPIKANGDSTLSLIIQSRTAESQQYIEAPLEITFTNKANGKPGPIAFLLLIVGLAIPFGILQLVNFLFARFRLETASIAVVRVKVNVTSDDRVTLTSFQEEKPLISENDFDTLPTHQTHEKSFDATTRGGELIAKLNAKLPLNPFGAVSGFVIANAGEAVSSIESPRNVPDGSRAGASLNPNGFFFVTAPKSSDVLENESGISYEATLTAFITDLMPGDSEGKVSNLREVIEQSDIWGDFARVLTSKPIEKKERIKSSKVKKDKNVSTTKENEDDPWGMGSSSSSSNSSALTSSRDAKKEKSPRSKSDENSKPATLPEVDEDDPWA